MAILDDAKDEGEETFRLRLSKAKGALIADGEAVGTIENDDPMPAAWLARFGRTVAGQAVDAVTDRLEGGGGNHVTLGGQPVNLDTAQGRAEAAADLDAVAAALGAGPEDRWPRDPWMRGGAPDEGAGSSSRTMTGRELLLGSAFHLVSKGDGSGPAFAAWGRVATGGFDGEADGVRLDGNVTTGFLGADVAGGRWLAGAAVAVSKGEGTFGLTGDGSWRNRRSTRATVESTLTSVLPYARLHLSERVTAWGLAGYGTGELVLTEKGGTETERHEADLTMTLGAVGGRGTLVPAPEGGGFELALKTDALWVRTESDATEGMEGGEGGRDAAQAHPRRLAALRALGRGHADALAGAGACATTAATPRPGPGWSSGPGSAGPTRRRGCRRSSGDAGSPRTSRRATRSGARAGQVRIDPGEAGRGLSLTFAPTVGNASSGTGTLWSAADARGIAPGTEFEAARRLDAEVGYGLALFGGRFTGTPHAGMALSQGAREYRLGWRLTSALAGDPGFEIGLDATRRESANDNAPPEHGIGVRMTARW